MDPQNYAERLALAMQAQDRARRANERAMRAERAAERHELLSARQRPGWEIHTQVAARHRRSAACHRSSARLQEAFARRATQWAEGLSAQPRFMTGVAEACGTTSAALTLVDSEQNQLAVATSNEPARAAQDLEYVLGEGPARDVTAARRPLHVSGPVIEKRWPGYGPALVSLGITAVAAVPLKAQDSCIGSLAVFDLGPPGRAVFVGLADVAEALTRIVVLGPDADPELYGGTDHRDTVQQAVGMLTVQSGCSASDALALIKARAFTGEMSTEVVARRILHGELELG
ncbi:GAF and ANTAR domain-containing protein [Streptomyces kanamyceticus]|uniref:GAF domain-containing protein n=1 Tax=Streptomyces kanamyceticus TaxID=1967 RepID=A0A5J6GEM8_STRKN|nr:GAF and ANTAR domain-containing protein [Streptomyces kanamyceticus]QEU93004.1 GAF domain-containing protein [Streptomyces kanamyceticus]